MSNAGLAQPLAPGGTVGILGGGQLGRMLALAAARLGLKAHVYSDDPGSPAFEVTSRATHGSFGDLPHLEAFAREVDVVTYEFENVPVAAARHIETFVPVRPGPRALAVTQDRLTEKTFVEGLGLPTAPFAEVSHRRDLVAALDRFAVPCILKTRRYGYDGRGQISVAPGDDTAAALAAIGHTPAIVEKRITFAFEISVLVVRSGDGTIAYYDVPQNTHGEGILRKSVVPAPLTDAEVGQAQSIAGRIAEALDYIGVLAVEMFYLGRTDDAAAFLVNELAPRVHNSGHWTIEACAISQFENHIRAVAGWPLGAPQRHSDAEMVNLIGDEAGSWLALAREPGLSLHLYGKQEARPGRKMGHVTRLLPLSTPRPPSGS